MSIVNTNWHGVVMSPLVIQDDSADAGLGPTPHSGTVAKAKHAANRGKRSEDMKSYTWIILGVATLWVLMQ
jgi:hypothetical protein